LFGAVVVAAPSVVVTVVVVAEDASVVAEGVVVADCSVDETDVEEFSSLPPLQEAATAAIANTKKSFFMFSVF
jgi:hypothetical protein